MLIKMTTFDKVIFLTSLLSIGYQDENEIGWKWMVEQDIQFARYESQIHDDRVGSNCQHALECLPIQHLPRE